jgi:hypothetical protein
MGGCEFLFFIQTYHPLQEIYLAEKLPSTGHYAKEKLSNARHD